MARGQKSRVLRVVQSMHDLFTVLCYIKASKKVGISIHFHNVGEAWDTGEWEDDFRHYYLGCDVHMALDIPNTDRVVPSSTVKGIC